MNYATPFLDHDVHPYQNLSLIDELQREMREAINAWVDVEFPKVLLKLHESSRTGEPSCEIKYNAPRRLLQALCDKLECHTLSTEICQGPDGMVVKVTWFTEPGEHNHQGPPR